MSPSAPFASRTSTFPCFSQENSHETRQQAKCHPRGNLLLAKRKIESFSYLSLAMSWQGRHWSLWKRQHTAVESRYLDPQTTLKPRVSTHSFGAITPFYGTRGGQQDSKRQRNIPCPFSWAGLNGALHGQPLLKGPLPYQTPVSELVG